jgi:phosphoribosylaminoimidazole-succinocarboxamide synthase
MTIVKARYTIYYKIVGNELSNLLGQRILVYEGSSKLLYAGIDSNTLILHFIKSDSNDIWRNKISESLWRYLADIGVENHFIRSLNIREQLITAVSVFPVFIRLHNIAEDDLSMRLGIEPGTIFPRPLIEWHLKSKYLGDPLISRDHIEFFEWLKPNEIKLSQKLAMRTNDILRALFHYTNLKPCSIELHFGIKDNRVMLVGELSPETITFWDELTGTGTDKDKVYEKMRAIPLQYFNHI